MLQPAAVSTGGEGDPTASDFLSADFSPAKTCLKEPQRTRHDRVKQWTVSDSTRRCEHKTLLRCTQRATRRSLTLQIMAAKRARREVFDDASGAPAATLQLSFPAGVAAPDDFELVVTDGETAAVQAALDFMCATLRSQEDNIRRCALPRAEAGFNAERIKFATRVRELETAAEDASAALAATRREIEQARRDAASADQRHAEAVKTIMTDATEWARSQVAREIDAAHARNAELAAHVEEARRLAHRTVADAISTAKPSDHTTRLYQDMLRDKDAAIADVTLQLRAVQAAHAALVTKLPPPKGAATASTHKKGKDGELTAINLLRVAWNSGEPDSATFSLASVADITGAAGVGDLLATFSGHPVYVEVKNYVHHVPHAELTKFKGQIEGRPDVPCALFLSLAARVDGIDDYEEITLPTGAKLFVLSRIAALSNEEQVARLRQIKTTMRTHMLAWADSRERPDVVNVWRAHAIRAATDAHDMLKKRVNELAGQERKLDADIKHVRGLLAVAKTEEAARAVAIRDIELA